MLPQISDVDLEARAGGGRGGTEGTGGVLGGAESPAGPSWGASAGEVGLPSSRLGGLPHVCLPRLWKVWVQVPSPKPFFQPLYDGHSGDFKVSAFATL